MKKRFEVLDSFRGLAALFVVIHHMHYSDSISELSFFKHSALFVEFFFILSGFVLAHGYAYKKDLHFKDYFIARTFRILPLHFVVLGAFILFELAKLWIHHNVMTLNTIPFENSVAVSEILPNMFLLQAWLPFAHSTSFNPPAWSISIEYYMYMIFFITLLFKSYLKEISWFVISLSMFTFIVIHFNIEQAILRGLSSFFLGALVYLVYKTFHTKVSLSNHFFTFFEIVLFIAIYYVIASDIAYQSIVVSVLFAVSVWVFSFEQGYISSFLKHKIFLYFGKLSYSIYMVHVLILFGFIWVILLIEKIFTVKFIVIVNGMTYIDLGHPMYNNLLIVFLLGIILFVSSLTYKYIEKTGQNWGKNLRNKVSE